MKEESENASLKLNIKKQRSWHLVPSLHGKLMRKKWKQWQILFSWAPKSLQTVTEATKLEVACSLKGKLWQTYFSSVQSLCRVQPFVTPWTAAHQASLSITNSQSLPKLMSTESVMPSNHLILCLFPFSSCLQSFPAMTNLDGILKSRDITLLTKVHIVKVMVFLVVMYRYESWTRKELKN